MSGVAATVRVRSAIHSIGEADKDDLKGRASVTLEVLARCPPLRLNGASRRKECENQPLTTEKSHGSDRRNDP